MRTTYAMLAARLASASATARRCTVPIGERGLDRHEQQPAAEAHDQDRDEGQQHEATRRQADRAGTHDRRGRPEQPAPSDQALGARGDQAGERLPVAKAATTSPPAE